MEVENDRTRNEREDREGIPMSMDIALFDYDLPQRYIAQAPASTRSHSKLMVLAEDGVAHERFDALVDHLTPNDTLVLNNSRVIPARLYGHKPTGGKVECLLLKRLNAEDDTKWQCLLRAKRLHEGSTVDLDIGVEHEGEDRRATLTVERRHADGRFDVRFDHSWPSFDALLDALGETPTPPYIKRELDKPERYQTVYSAVRGSVAAPTAGLHFTPALIEAIESRGIEVAYITLHVGLGTFQPVRTQYVEAHTMHEEYFVIDAHNRAVLQRAYDDGRRLVAVGTTVLKTLETACRVETGVVESDGWSDLFIYPGYRFKAGVEVLLTNFHLPRSTLIMLVSAFTGRRRILDAYEIAKREGYRFYSFGDAMLIPYDPHARTEIDGAG